VSDNPVPAGSGALLLLFPRGKRPGNEVLRATAAGSDRVAVTSTLAGDGNGTVGVELLRDGMTYDLVGAAPGPGMTIPALRHRMGVGAGLETGDLEALALRAGPHLSQGPAIVPVVRTMMGVASMIVPHLPGLAAVAWSESGALIGCEFFISVMSAWVSGGAFPALGLTAFAADGEGGLRSEGLAFFTGQELRLAAELTEDRAAGTRLGVRLINQLVGRPALKQGEAVVGPDGQQLMLEPSPDRRVLRVRRG
jgi:hypothetical protein